MLGSLVLALNVVEGVVGVLFVIAGAGQPFSEICDAKASARCFDASVAADCVFEVVRFWTFHRANVPTNMAFGLAVAIESATKTLQIIAREQDGDVGMLRWIQFGADILAQVCFLLQGGIPVGQLWAKRRAYTRPKIPGQTNCFLARARFRCSCELTAFD